jgi:hypothetical protein
VIIISYSNLLYITVMEIMCPSDYREL